MVVEEDASNAKAGGCSSDVNNECNSAVSQTSTAAYMDNSKDGVGNKAPKNTSSKHQRTLSKSDNQLHPKDIIINVEEKKELVYQTTSPNDNEAVAISLQSAYKHYGSGKTKTAVLLGLDMKVEKGTIYGLLGPSGCGKTTLLKCIVGKLKLDSGNIKVFGETPGTPDLGVPGSRVGYMPQELALFGEFNIAETLRYFSRIFGMSKSKYQERIDFLIKFLDLPSRTRMLQKMSGGQQRRASLAVALLHEPELLILDEPTVGVDPLLRTTIWKHLLELSSPTQNNSEKGGPFGGSTIVITTHYIEEARQAHRVGMMRFGKLLAEDAPQSLLQRFQRPSLEEVFLELCMQDGDLDTTKKRLGEKEKKRPILKSINRKKNNKCKEDDKSETGMPLKSNENGIGSNFVLPPKCTPAPPGSTKKDEHFSIHGSHRNHGTICNLHTGKVIACMIKTFNRMKKRIGFLIYQFVLPAIQVSLFCLAIGQDPKDLPVAVVNMEPGGMESCLQGQFDRQCPLSVSSFGIEPNEHLANFTCRYLSFLDTSVVSPEYYASLSEARLAVENGEVWAVLHVSENFTSDLYQRIFDSMTLTDFEELDKQLFDKSSIKIAMDVTSQHIAFTLQLKFVEAFDQFMRQMVSSCNIPEEIASIPLVFEDPIYGSKELTFTDFMAPGIILTIVHSMALGYSAMIIIIERNEGLLDRTWVAGVTPGEFALAHFLVSLVVNLIQVIVTLVFMILVFQVPAEGSIVWIFLLTMLQGICGTTIGLIISAVCDTQQDATQIALGIFYPNLILSGIIWPLESMPSYLRYFSYLLPQTFACDAMRGILLRGWGITYMPVWRGYLVTIAWIVVTYGLFKKIVGKDS